MLGSDLTELHSIENIFVLFYGWVVCHLIVGKAL